MKACAERTCPLWGNTEVPFEKGKGTEILWYGESPGKWEEAKGKPFYYKAAAGSLLRECMGEAGLHYGDYFFGNAARCRIDKEALTGKEISTVLECCRDNALAPIYLLKPKAVVLMGDYALRQVLRKNGITKCRGKWIWNKDYNCWVLPMFHPAYICRNMGLKKRLISDITMVREFIENNYHPLTLGKEDTTGYLEVDSLGPFLKTWHQQRATVSFDSETQGLDRMDPNFLMLSFSVSDAEAVAHNVTLYEEVPQGEHEFSIMWPRPEPGKKKMVPTEVFVRRTPGFKKKLSGLKTFLEDGKIKKYMMNGNFDIHCTEALFRREGLPAPQIHGYVMDIQAASNLIDENMFKLPSLEDLQMAFTDMREDYKSDFQKKYGVGDMLKVPREDRKNYACADADVTRRVGMTLKKELVNGAQRLGRYLINFTMPALGLLGEMERIGARIDRERLPHVKADVEREMHHAEKRALAVVPQRIRKVHEARGLSLTRDEFVADILFDKRGFGLQGIKRTDSKQGWSIAKGVRKVLVDQDLSGEAREFLEAYEEFQEDHTMWSRYLTGFEKAIRADGRVHTTFSLAATVTGRTSSSKPNMQNTPKRSKSAERIRQLIVASPGYVLLSADAGQSELRWCAAISKDREMLRIFHDGVDIHTETAMSLLRVTKEEWDRLPEKKRELHRREAKCVNFGVIYLMSPRGFVDYAKKEYNLNLKEDEAAEWIAAFFTKFNGIPKYHQRMIHFGREHGYVESPFGRQRRLPELYSDNGGLRAEAERQAVNHPIQSPSSDTVLLAGIEIRKQVSDLEKVRPILFVHDELTFEVREKDAAKWARIMKHEMEHPPLERAFDYRMTVPLDAEPKVGKNLAAMENT